MTAFDHLESPLHEAPLFYIEPRDRDPRAEDERQREWVVAARKSGLYVCAVLNGEKRGQWALNLARRLGAWWGFPDAIAIGRGRFIAFLEWKDGTEQPKQHQIDCMNLLWRMGFPVGVFRTSERAMAWLDDAGAPIRERAA
jgi:hypothetical protein